MKRWFRALFAPAPSTAAEPSPPDPGDRLRRLEELIEEFERHRWELQHRINVLQEDLARAREQNAGAAREACRAELAVFRRDFEPAFRDIYGTIGVNFRRLSVPGVEDSAGRSIRRSRKTPPRRSDQARAVSAAGDGVTAVAL